jgi:hypothetical protein
MLRKEEKKLFIWKIADLENSNLSRNDNGDRRFSILINVQITNA